MSEELESPASLVCIELVTANCIVIRFITPAAPSRPSDARKPTDD